VDYKTVASAVARLYQEGKISQDKDGKFKLKIAKLNNAGKNVPLG
jgi:hypothetical protein